MDCMGCTKANNHNRRLDTKAASRATLRFVSLYPVQWQIQSAGRVVVVSGISAILGLHLQVGLKRLEPLLKKKPQGLLFEIHDRAAATTTEKTAPATQTTTPDWIGRVLASQVFASQKRL